MHVPCTIITLKLVIGGRSGAQTGWATAYSARCRADLAVLRQRRAGLPSPPPRCGVFQPAPQPPAPQPPASETPPAAPPSAAGAPAAETPAAAPGTEKPLPTIAVTTERPKQRAATATNRPATATNRPGGWTTRTGPAGSAGAVSGATGLPDRRSQRGGGDPGGAAVGEPDDGFRRGRQRASDDAPRRGRRSGARHGGDRAFRRLARPPVLPARLELSITAPTSPYSVDDVPDQFAEQCARAGLLRPQLAHSGNGRRRGALCKGPFFADVGDFGNAGNLHIGFRDAVDKNIEQVTVGSFGYDRFLALGSTKLGSGSLRYMPAHSIPTMVRGPIPTTCAHSAALQRYSQGTATDGVSLTAQGLRQQLERRRSSGAAGASPRDRSGFCGQQDPTDGGDASRFSLSARMAQSDTRRIVESQCLFRLIHPEPRSQLRMVHDPRDSPLPSRLPTPAISSIRTRSASTPAAARRAPSMARCSACRPRPYSACRPDTTALATPPSTRFSASPVRQTSATASMRVMSEFTPKTRCIGPTGSKPHAGWRGDAFAASVNSTLQPANSGRGRDGDRQPEIHGRSSARSTKPSCSPAPAWGITAMMRAPPW